MILLVFVNVILFGRTLSLDDQCANDDVGAKRYFDIEPDADVLIFASLGLKDHKWQKLPGKSILLHLNNSSISSINCS